MKSMKIFRKHVEEPEMVEIEPSVEDHLRIRMWKGIVAQIFVRYTPKMERVKWLMPQDDLSGYNVEEGRYIRIYRNGTSTKVEVRYEQLPHVESVAQLSSGLAKLIVELKKHIMLDVMFDTLSSIAAIIWMIIQNHPTLELWENLDNFRSNLVIGFDENEMTWLSDTVIFHDSDIFRDTQQNRVSTQLTVTDRWTGDITVLTLVDIKDRNDTIEEAKNPDYPPVNYVSLRDKYTRGDIGITYCREELFAAMGVGRELSARRRLELNAAHAAGAHEFCMALLAAS